MLQPPCKGQNNQNEEDQAYGPASDPRPPGIKSSTAQHDEQNNQYQQ